MREKHAGDRSSLRAARARTIQPLNPARNSSGVPLRRRRKERSRNKRTKCRRCPFVAENRNWIPISTRPAILPFPDSLLLAATAAARAQPQPNLNIRPPPPITRTELLQTLSTLKLVCMEAKSKGILVSPFNTIIVGNYLKIFDFAQ